MIRLTRGVRSWVRSALAADPRLVALPVTPEIAIAAGSLVSMRDPGDSIVYATSVEHDAPLVSRDARLQRHDPKRVIW